MGNTNPNIIFLGDISLNNGYRDVKTPFKNIIHEFAKTDWIVGNLESFLKGDEGFDLNKKPYLYSEEKAFLHLLSLKLNLVSTAHNHVFDNFDSGYNETIKFLKANNISYIGSSYKGKKNNFLTKKKIYEKSFTFLNYCHPDTNYNKKNTTNINLSVYNNKQIIKDIEKSKKESNYIILLLHWGGKSDYGYIPSKYQVTDAKLFIDAGADVIVGHHSHCIQPIQYYKNKPIIYSLGNFCFDTIISHNKEHAIRKNGNEGLIVKLSFGNNINLKIIGIKNKDLLLNTSKKVYLKTLLLNNFFKIFYRFDFLYDLNRFFLKYIEPKIFYIEQSEKNIWQKVISFRISKFIRFIKFKK